MRRSPAAAALALCVFAGGCMVGPDYKRPAAPASPGFKELRGIRVWRTGTWSR